MSSRTVVVVPEISVSLASRSGRKGSNLGVKGVENPSRLLRTGHPNRIRKFSDSGRKEGSVGTDKRRDSV